MFSHGVWSLAALSLLAACVQTAGGLRASGESAALPGSSATLPTATLEEAPAAAARP